MKTITTKEFDKEVLQSDLPVMLKFTAEWCGPCVSLQPLLEQIAEEVSSKAKILKLDIDDSPEIASRYKVKSIPAMLVFKGGQVVSTQIGRTTKDKIMALFQFEETEQE